MAKSKKKSQPESTKSKPDEDAVKAAAEDTPEEGAEEVKSQGQESQGLGSLGLAAAAEEGDPEEGEEEVEEAPEEVVHTDINAIDKVLGLVIDELQKRFDDRVPVAVLKLLLPTITKLINAGELDVKVRMQLQARIDDALRKLGMI